MKLVRASDQEWEAQWEEETQNLEALGTPIVVTDSRTQMDRQRRVLIGITVTLVAIMPVVQFYMPSANSYILSAAMAFTIGTNLTIFIISTQIEDKASEMERRIENLTDELDRAQTGLDNFHSELSSVNIPAIVDGIDRARSEMSPSLERLQGVSWEQLSDSMNQIWAFWDRVNKDKLNKFIAPFIDDDFQLVPTPVRTFDEFDEFLPELEDDDEFMPGL